jgi:hypothetical protein
VYAARTHGRAHKEPRGERGRGSRGSDNDGGGGGGSTPSTRTAPHRFSRPSRSWSKRENTSFSATRAAGVKSRVEASYRGTRVVGPLAQCTHTSHPHAHTRTNPRERTHTHIHTHKRSRTLLRVEWDGASHVCTTAQFQPLQASTQAHTQHDPLAERRCGAGHRACARRHSSRPPRTQGNTGGAPGAHSRGPAHTDGSSRAAYVSSAMASLQPVVRGTT